MTNRNCIECGVEFRAKSVKHRLCPSDDCRKADLRKRNKRAYNYKPHPKVTKVCVGCDEEFKTRMKHQKYHSKKCRLKYRKVVDGDRRKYFRDYMNNVTEKNRIVAARINKQSILFKEIINSSKFMSLDPIKIAKLDLSKIKVII